MVQINKGIDMKELCNLIITVCLMLIVLVTQFGKSVTLYEQKTALEIEKLYYELNLYHEQEDIDKKSVE